MANDYYVNSVALPAYGRAKSTDVDGDFNSIEDGFDKLPAPHADAPTTKGFSEVFKVIDGTDEMHPAPISQVRDAILVGTDAGAADAYVVTMTPAPSAYTTGMLLMFKPTYSNTGACTVNVNSLGAKSIKSTDGGNPAANELYAGNYALLIYDGTNFQLMTASMSALTAPSETIPSASGAYKGLRVNSAGSAYELGQPEFQRNRIINSEMMIDQRNAGAATTATASFTVDRFSKAWANTDELAISAVQSTGIGGYRNSIKVTATTPESAWATDEYLIPIRYKFLGYDVADLVNGAAVTISFYFKSNHPDNSVFSVALVAGDSGYSYVTDFTYTTSAAEQLVTKTITIPAHASNYISNTTTGVGLMLYIGAVAGTDYQGTADQWNAAHDMCSASATDWTQAVTGPADGYIQVSGVSFREGSVHAPLEKKSYDEYLDECLPYTYRYDFTGAYSSYSVNTNLHGHTYDSGGKARVSVTFPKKMIGLVSVYTDKTWLGFTDSAGTASGAVTSISVPATDNFAYGCNLVFVKAGAWTTNLPGYVYRLSADAVLYFTAEL